MAAGDTQITIAGNLVDDPELRYTPTGQAVANFRVASTPRFLDKATNEWKDGDSLFLTCNVWRQAAENVAESLQRGMRVIVTGRLKQRSYETREGEKRTVYEIEVDDVGPSMRRPRSPSPTGRAAAAGSAVAARAPSAARVGPPGSVGHPAGALRRTRGRPPSPAGSAMAGPPTSRHSEPRTAQPRTAEPQAGVT
jgi:single-strand DNA-binding protein